MTANRFDSLKFKVSGLRNCTLAFPYMHDGSIYTLGKVIDYYRTGIDTTQPTPDVLLKKGITISDQKKLTCYRFY